jgi:hypothetical protein
MTGRIAVAAFASNTGFPRCARLARKGVQPAEIWALRSRSGRAGRKVPPDKWGEMRDLPQKAALSLLIPIFVVYYH